MSQVAEVTAAKGRVKFGTFEADLKSGELLKSGVRVKIQSQPFKVLTVLLEFSGEVVTREELQHRVWGSGTTVDFDHSLGIAINKLREALGDSAENPRFVETLARRGYRFIAPIAIASPTPTRSWKPEPPRPAPRSHFKAWPIVAGILLAAIVAGIAVWLRPGPTTVRRISRMTYSGDVLEPTLDVGSIFAPVTDGSRLYFSQTEDTQVRLAQSLIANGEIGEFKLPSEIASPVIAALSPDKANLIVHNDLVNDSEQPFWIVPTLGGTAQRIPNLLAQDATWMPDGKRILYAQGNSLFVARKDGTEIQKYADVPGWPFWLRWAPDGKTLRFSLRDAENQTSLWEMGADGRGVHALLPGWSVPTYECCGSWTNDGKFFVFQSRHGGHSDLWVRKEGGNSAPAQLTNGPLDYEAPATGGQDHRVYFVGSDPEIELLRFNRGSGVFTRMEGTFSSAELTAFSRDGQWVAWLNTMDGSLWRSRADGSDRFQLTLPPLRIFMMRWSPDDKQLAIMAQEPGKPWKIYLEDAIGGRLDPLLNENLNEADPDWSGDGRMLVIGRLPQRMSPANEPKAIYTVDVATRSVAEVPGSTGLFSPRFSPDGRYIAAIALVKRSLMMFDREKNQWRTLSTHAAADPQWSHDSQSIYFQDTLVKGKPVYRVDVQSGNLEQVASLDSLRPLSARDYRLITLAPGDLPVVSAWTSNVNLYSIDLDE